MSEAEAPAPSRGRATRAAADATQRERRYRPSENAEGVDYNLWVDTSKLDPNYKYRWVNDARGRIPKLHGQDWDPVAEADVGFPVDRHADIAAGKSEDLRVRLMRKPLDWFNEDHQRKQKRIDDQMERAARGDEIIQGKGDDAGAGLNASTAYMPHGANKL